MALKMRLKRMGKKGTPFYRLVVVDSRWRRDGKTIADVGWYDPIKQPAQMAFKEKEIYHWLENGVQPTETARALLKRQGILARFRSGEYKTLSDDQMVDNQTVIKMGEDAPVKPAPKPAPAPAKVEEAPAAPVAPAESEPVAEEAPAAPEAPAEESVEPKAD